MFRLSIDQSKIVNWPVLHRDNAESHVVSQMTAQKLNEIGIEIVSYTTNTSDISSTDYLFF